MNNVSRSAMASRTPEMLRTLSRALFQCRVCKKGYDRADHLKRHVRSRMWLRKSLHDLELLRRHTQSHSSEINCDESGGCSGIVARASQACKRCAASKLKCDDDKPCRRCVRRNQICQWSPREDTLATQEFHVNTTEHELQSAKQTGKDLLDSAQARIPSENSELACIIEGTVHA
ncbi:uncharacterized protein N7496_008427 [Penicillium cataractarum]|uniref:Zn(2)-C6 fungal-type domain-containing protein n=1 Tax=Penicillium cataractarum TaxID=2100454 RepID=A0A9W9V4R6_9EURO|nr:uncharacterized protein N7496_008427 [Penicillium cataractarum]KAJ5368667.1 hypothetical protein N7496_008427 [Penicillium cataractarum]